jgi:fibronectin type 3 domain-containing protein
LSLAPGASGTVTLKVSTSIDNNEGSYLFTSSVSSSSHSSASVTGTVNLDGSAPTAPANLNGSAKRKALNLSWSASSDAVSGVAYYRVFRNGVKIAERSSTDYSDRDLVSGSSYSYTVDAVDNAGHISAASNSFSYTASSGGGSNGKKPRK